MIEVVLWDNDGLLIDSEAVFFDLTRQVFAGAGYDLSAHYWGIEYLGKARRTREVAEEFGMASRLIDEVIELRDQRFFEALQRPLPLRPGVRDTLDSLRGKVRHGLVTGSPRDKVDLMHHHSGLEGYFDVIVTCDDVTQTKPYPEPYRKAMERFGLDPARCLAVEDSERGLASAHAAGVSCIVVPNPLTRIQQFKDAYAVEEEVSGVMKYLG